MHRKSCPMVVSVAASLLCGPVGAQTVFTYTGSLQPYTVPANVDTLFVRLWGAGGSDIDSSGGGGAFVSGDLSVTPGSTLEVLVGGGRPISYNGSFGGGGYSIFGPAGGRSAIILSGADLVDAGGGGGGLGDAGGAGGLATGQNGGGEFGTGGGGGTQTSGGVVGFGGGGENGSLYQGGGDSMLEIGGGGGGGYYGGASGSEIGGGGGGGSSLTSSLTGFVGEAGNGMTPGGTSDPFYIFGVGGGGEGSLQGGNGEVVITTLAPTAVPEPGALAMLLGAGFSGTMFTFRRRRRKAVRLANQAGRNRIGC